MMIKSVFQVFLLFSQLYQALAELWNFVKGTHKFLLVMNPQGPPKQVKNVLDKKKKDILSADHCGHLAALAGQISSTILSTVCIMYQALAEFWSFVKGAHKFLLVMNPQRPQNLLDKKKKKILSADHFTGQLDIQHSIFNSLHYQALAEFWRFVKGLTNYYLS